MQQQTKILDDAVILDHIRAFQAWRVGNPVSTDGLDRMLRMIMEAIEAGTPFWQVIRARTLNHLQNAHQAALALSPDFGHAIGYLRHRFAADPASLDADPAVLYACELARAAGTLFPQAKSLMDFRLAWNASVMSAGEGRFLAFFSMMDGTPLNERDQKSLRTPLAVEISITGFPMPYYIDSMQMGMLAWGEGERLAMDIYNTLIDPRSRGQLASLIPTDVAETVPETDLAWRRNPDLQDWLNGRAEPGSQIPDSILAAYARAAGGLM